MFKLDAGAARAADNKSAFIDDAGKCIGTFVRAEYMEKQATGSVGLGLTFKTDAGAEAQFYINLSYQHGTKNDGGHQTLNAIMACLKLREVPAPTPITFDKWDKDAGQRVTATAPGFPALMGKPIGLLIQMEIEKNSENGNPRPTIYMPFSAESEKTASEILDPKCMAPAKLEKAVQVVMGKPVVDRRPKGGVSGGIGGGIGGGNVPEIDNRFDDIPFD